MKIELIQLIASVESLIADMRIRSIIRGDLEVEEDGTKIAILDCSDSALYGIEKALEDAKEAVANEPITVFEKVYSGENLIDLEEDVNSTISVLDTDEFGFVNGDFTVVIKRTL